jgi:hypothetical protein
METDRRTLAEITPLKNALQYVVSEARKHQLAGNDDHFVAVGRACQAVLKWQEADQAGNIETAQEWLAKMPDFK